MMDESTFIFIGNHFVTDFVNTRKNVKGIRTELLNNCEGLVRWLQETDRLSLIEGDPLSLSQHDQEEILSKVLAIRERLENYMEEIINQRKLPDFMFEDLNTHLLHYRSYLQVNQEQSILKMVRKYSVDNLPGLFLDEIAQFMTSISPAKLKKCKNPACILYFYDKSKNQQRQWCSMEKCGNRVKVNNHYHRMKKIEQEAE
ncbi:zf-CGNR multi-domain protein [Paenibacillus zeisoli]|uniref:Zf-CGNR multi-domain protein n=1 Tax=Paenibacillus zeisoli TaxID=2496267 RepID=A0A433XI50_9BACL|nr:CGNR zinc finger domain-containing protein [Paenibacillus zeisoli]RUT33704.1 zf-CGNR multi-domain protein [Paenibacillus zeisoli]